MTIVKKLRSDALAASARSIERGSRELPWSTPQKMALACQILAELGMDSGLSGQLSARTDDRAHYLVKEFGIGFDEVTARDLVEVDEDLVPTDSDKVANPGNRFHIWLYQARPDVNCIVHTHALYCSALSMVEEPLAISHMDATPLFEDCAFLKKWPGVPSADEVGMLICETLGSKHAILLGHHGLLTAAASVEEACALAIRMERAARLQVLASGIGTIKQIDSDLAREAHDRGASPRRLSADFAYYARRVLRRFPDCIDVE